MTSIILIAASMLLRLATFAVVMNYYKDSRHRSAWLLIAAAMVLLALENLFQLLAIAGVSNLAQGQLIPHSAGFAVSVLMLTGTAMINTILKRLAAAERRKESIEKRYRLLFDTTSDLLFVLQTDGQITEVNQATCDRLKMSRQQLLSKRFADIKAGAAAEGVMDHLNDIQKKGYHIFETELLTGQGQRFPVELNCRLVDIDENQHITCIGRSTAQRRELDKKVRIAIIETEERERRRFAKEIHDGLGPLLSTVKLYVNELETTAPGTDEHTEYIGQINHLLNEAIDNARNIANNITPRVLSDYGLQKAIESFAETINSTKLLKINTRFTNIGRNIGATLELMCYRIISELINNTIKHANASTIDIALELRDGKLHLDYRDNGQGFDLQDAIEKGDNHMGVKNIISRVRSLNGVFNFRNTWPGIEIQIILDVQTAGPQS
ncbi:MAG: PAS domain S-box protein [Bacteroidetes bacterium]|nr:PAS domain S-box protein [Bacteroidota bacterium]